MEPQTSVQPDPSTQPASDAQDKPKGKIPVLYRIYGLYCFVSAAIVLGLIITITVLSTAKVIDLTAGSNNASLTFILTVIQFVLMGIEAVAMIGFGISLLRSRRRHAAQMAYALIAINIVGTLIEIMLHGFGENLIGAGVQLAILTIISVTVDPTLREERRRERIERDAELEREAKAGTLGRAEGRPRVHRARLLQPVLGVRGVLLPGPGHRDGLPYGRRRPRRVPGSRRHAVRPLLAHLRIRRGADDRGAQPFLQVQLHRHLPGERDHRRRCSRRRCRWFMQTAFGAVAWDYTGSTIFGLFPDPIAEIFHGRTSRPVHAACGAPSACVWIKLCLPWLLKLINLIPWKARYGVHDALRRLDAGERRHDARGARLLVPARIGLPSPRRRSRSSMRRISMMRTWSIASSRMTITPEHSVRVDAGTANPAS